MQYTIIGGIKRKLTTAKKMNIPPFEPSEVDIFISEAAPIVLVGENVVTGQAIAKNDDGFTIYSSIDGRVEKITNKFISLCGNLKADVKSLEPYTGNFDAEDRDKLIEYLLGAGIPDAIEISLRREMGNTKQVIINCMSESSTENLEEIINGAKIILLALGKRNAVIALSKKNKKLAKAIEKIRYDREMFLIAMLPERHPLEDPRAISTALFPYTAYDDVFAISPYSCIGAYEAFIRQKPYIGRLLKLVYKNRYTLVFCPAGTNFQKLSEYATQSLTAKNKKLEAFVGVSGIGTPIDGEMIIGDDINAVTFKKSSPTKAEKNAICISCGKCRSVCPRELSPYMIASGACTNGIQKCISCGCCSHVCPVGIPLSGLINNKRRGASNED